MQRLTFGESASKVVADGSVKLSLASGTTHNNGTGTHILSITLAKYQHIQSPALGDNVRSLRQQKAMAGRNI